MAVDINWGLLRADYPILEERTYLNTPAYGPMHPKVQQAASKEMEAYAAGGADQFMEFVFTEKARIAEAIGQFVKAPAEQLALSQNFSVPMNMVAEMLHPLGNVALVEGDYPSLTMPFRLRDYEVHELSIQQDARIDYDALSDLIKQNDIKLLAISHVQWSSGYVVDLEKVAEICTAHQTKLLVDGTQSIGVIPTDLGDINPDVFIASTYKWLGAGHGNGFIYVKSDLLDEFKPRTAGFNSFLWKDGKPYYEPNIHCFEPGHLDSVAFARLKAAIDLQMEIGQDRIFQRVRELVDSFKEYSLRTGIPLLYDFKDKELGSILFVKGSNETIRALKSNRVEAVPRGKGVRIGLHWYNNLDDIARFWDVYARVG